MKLITNFLKLPDRPLQSTTQSFLPIADICDDIVLYKDGGAALTLESTSLNFGLLSEKEQEAIVAAYAATINSLTFPIQIIIRSQKKDISDYIEYLNVHFSKITNQKLNKLAYDYKRFILESIKKKNVLGKSFYLVIPFSPLELGVAKSFITSFSRSDKLPFPKSYVVKKAKVTLYPKRDHLIRQARRLGLNLKQLSTDQLIKLYYEVFNPDKIAVKKTQQQSKQT